MKVGIIGSGVVAQTLGTKLVELGHDVVLGTRDPKKLDEKKNMAGTLNEWLAVVKNKAKVATFKEAAAHGEILISAETVRENARRFGNSLNEELGLCLTHGLLHLGGYKDERADEAKAMRLLQGRIVRQCLLALKKSA